MGHWGLEPGPGWRKQVNTSPHVLKKNTSVFSFFFWNCLLKSRPEGLKVTHIDKHTFYSSSHNFKRGNPFFWEKENYIEKIQRWLIFLFAIYLEKFRYICLVPESWIPLSRWQLGHLVKLEHLYCNLWRWCKKVPQAQLSCASLRRKPDLFQTQSKKSQGSCSHSRRVFGAWSMPRCWPMSARYVSCHTHVLLFLLAGILGSTSKVISPGSRAGFDALIALQQHSQLHRTENWLSCPVFSKSTRGFYDVT